MSIGQLPLRVQPGGLAEETAIVKLARPRAPIRDSWIPLRTAVAAYADSIVLEHVDVVWTICAVVGNNHLFAFSGVGRWREVFSVRYEAHRCQIKLGIRVWILCADTTVVIIPKE